jgi:GNAT superfamily N-acetyltransferase
MATIRQMRISDLQQVNGIISRAFTQGRIDDGYAFTKVPMCQTGFIEMYYHQGAEGTFVVEEAGQIRGAAFCHIWGKTGWIGPLAIAPEKHHLGIGKRLAEHATNYLKKSGCITVGLETNPRSNRNLGFYGKIGYVPSALSIDLIKPVSTLTMDSDISPHSIIPYSKLSDDQKEKFHFQVDSLLQTTLPNVDLKIPIKAYDQFEQGETLLFMRNNTPIAVAILQTKPSLVEEQNKLLRIVTCVAHPKTPDGYFSYFLQDFLTYARDNYMDRILIRTPVHSQKTFQALLDNNYRVVNSDLRMTLKGFPETNNPKLFLMNRWV